MSVPKYRRLVGDPLLTVPEAADWMRVSERTIYHAIRTGRLQAITVGRQIQLRRSTLERGWG